MSVEEFDRSLNLTANVTARDLGGRSSRNTRSLVILLLVWGMSAFYMATHLRRGWVPHDEGALAQTAERAMNGEMPHRDFIEPYTGGLTALHSFAFRHLGVDLFSLRIVLFVFFLAWVPAVHFIARELAPDWTAAGITLLAVAWSVPNYAAALPSWYNLFFATFGIAAVLGYLRTPRPFSLFFAGTCAGLSFLAKSAGLYFVAAILIFFVFREQSLSARGGRANRPLAPFYFMFVVLLSVTLVVSVGVLLGCDQPPQEYLEFLLPAALMAFLLLARERRRVPGSNLERFVTLFRMVAPFLAGAAVPIALFLLPYLQAHSMEAFVRGVFVLPAKRISSAAMYAQPIYTRIPLVSIISAVTLLARTRGRVRRAGSVILPLLLATVIALSFRSALVYGLVWQTAETAIPFLAILGVARLLGYPRSSPPPSLVVENRLLLLVSAASLCTLIRFPFAGQIYFCYLAPLVILAYAALLGTLPMVPVVVRLTLAGYYLVLVVFLLTPVFIYEMGDRYLPDEQVVPMDLPRAGRLRVSRDSASVYARLIPLVRQRASSGGILAGPDCPEVYFLAGKRNPTPALFDFFEDQSVRERRLLRLVDDPTIKVLVVNTDPSFSGSYPDALHDRLTQQFEGEEEIGDFEVWWRP